jgi:N-acetylglucosaminyldiphosphoundecaprenol N-acetyl-beta-D-mannosaminyltransferase
MIVEAQKNSAFKSLLQKTSLNLPDGAGLLWAAKKTGQKISERVTGTDVFTDLCMLADLPSIFLLGAADGVAKRAAEILTQKNPSLTIAGTFAGTPAESDEAGILTRINESGAKVLFVAYGAPKQDMWINRNLSKLPNIHLAMGLGGAFDFVAGVQTRAPQWMQSLGLEWMWRLIKQPSRIKRIFTAVIIFPWMVWRGDAQT